MILQPLQCVLEPVKIKPASREAVICQQQRAKNRRPFPAKLFLFSNFDENHRGKNVYRRRNAQPPEHQHPAVRRG